MKVALSMPESVFKQVEFLAREQGRARNELIRQALVEYVARHTDAAITDAWNRVCSSVNEPPDPFVEAAGRETLRRTEW